MGKWNKNKLGNCSSVPLVNSKYNILDPIVEDIYNNCVKLNEEETTALKERFRTVIDKYVEIMREVDPTFKDLFNRINYTGSFYDGLRITEATEFDLNLVLKPNITMKLIRKRVPAGFVVIKVDRSSTFLPAQCKDWITNNAFLDPNAVRSWLQGVVTKTLQKLEENKLILGCKLKLHQSGPAWTLTVTSQEPPGKTIDIDLVPVLEFPTSYELLNQQLRKKHIRDKFLDFTEPWFAVPKPPAYSRYKRIAWRMSFPIQESALIQNLHFFKYTLRLVKKVRDSLEIHEVASYYIKTLFLLELLRNGTKQWMCNRRGHLFIYMLNCLINALEVGRIPFIWNQNCNLVGNVNIDSLRNSANQLRGFQDRIQKLLEKKDEKQLKHVIQSLLNS